MAKKVVVQVLASATAVTQEKMPNVGFIRPEIVALREQYDLISDVLGGEIAIKKKGDKYLPRPNSSDQSEENKSRYDAYKMRAKFMGATKRTLGGMVGQVFMRDPVVEIPTLMDVLKGDFSGSGVTLNQTASMLVAKALAFGRVGLFIDYPDTDTPATVQAIQSGKVRPAVLMFNPWEVINWRTVVIDGRELLSLVVIYEQALTSDDGFETKTEQQWRVLSLKEPSTQQNDAVPLTGKLTYTVDVWKKTAGGFAIDRHYQPKDSKGQPLTEIPFKFIGANNNDASPDDPPLYDLASLNIGHYCNSADYEEACFLCGQPTPVFTGLTQDWVENVLKNKILLGSRSSIPLPPNATAELLQAAANSMPKEAMEMKERQMVALGARLVQQAQVQRTATEAGQEEAAQTSVLANVANNVELGIVFALNWCARFMGAVVPEHGQDGAIGYELNTQFDLTQLAPDEQAQVIAAWQSGLLTTSEARAIFRRGGYATLDDAAYAAQKKKEVTDGTAPPTPPPSNNSQTGGKNPVAPAPAAA